MRVLAQYFPAFIAARAACPCAAMCMCAMQYEWPGCPRDSA